MAKATAADFVSLDKMENLQPRPEAKGSKKRNVTEGARQDAVSEALAKCNLPSEIAALATRFGLTAEEIAERSKKAANLGGFRMVIGNRMRGVVSKIQAAQKAGVTLTAADAASMSKGRVNTKIKNAGKPAKTAPKATAKPVAKPAPKATSNAPAPKAAATKPAPKPVAKKPVAAKANAA